MARKAEPLSSLFNAAENGQRDMVESMLSKKGAKVDAKEPTFGMTALHIASARGHKEVVELLISMGSNLEAREETGRTPMHSASFRGQLPVVEVLLAKGAQVNAQTNDGKTALDWAVLNHKTDVAEFIRQNGGKCGKEIAPVAGAKG